MGVLKRAARWIAVSTVGSILVVAGVAMFFLPGPGLLVLVAGLAVLSIEFLWAQRLRDRTVRRLRDIRPRRSSGSDTVSTTAGRSRDSDAA